MSLRTLPAHVNLRGKRVLVRVDWNVPHAIGLAFGDSLKIEQTIQFLKQLASRGAVVVLLTHLGRPKGREAKFSTRHLIPLLKRLYTLDVAFHPESVGVARERTHLIEALEQAVPGSIHLLENVRFQQGEETNALSLAKAYASLGNLFINDAFASCHRNHASVVGVAKQLPAYAGSELVREVAALERLRRPARPFVAVVGGLKLSTKLPLLSKLLRQCDAVLVGGAMATTLAAAGGVAVGASAVEKKMAPHARLILSSKKLFLPIDVKVRTLGHGSLRIALMGDIRTGEEIVDVGPQTLVAWATVLKRAKTILWNGPVGIVEERASGAGSRFLARAIAMRTKGKAYGVVGGGDTLPVVAETRTGDEFDHVSTGGGALLAFVANGGKLPGLAPLTKK